MLKVLKIVGVFIICLLALIGLLFLGFRLYNQWYFASEQQCVDHVYYSFGSLDDRHQLSLADYRQVFIEAEARFESEFKRDIFSYHEGNNTAQNIVKYHIAFDPVIQTKLHSLDTFVSENTALHEKISAALAEHQDLKDQYETEREIYESLSSEYKVFSAKQENYNKSFDEGRITAMELEAYQDEKRALYLETNESRLRVNTLSEQVTSKAIEANTYIRENEGIRVSFDEINQQDLNQALHYERTPFSYDITVLYFSNLDELEDRIVSSFHSILDDVNSLNKDVNLALNDESGLNIDVNDLQFTICD